jgi:hypothetical protein
MAAITWMEQVRSKRAPRLPAQPGHIYLAWRVAAKRLAHAIWKQACHCRQVEMVGGLAGRDGSVRGNLTIGQLRCGVPFRAPSLCHSLWGVAQEHHARRK